MAKSQRKFREVVFQILYSWELNKGVEAKELFPLLDHLLVSRKTLYEAFERAKEVAAHFSLLDPLLSRFCKGYELEKISPAERSILRLSLYELHVEKELPPKVALCEGVRLATTFATPEGGAFVNAILDAIFHAGDPPCLSPPALSAANP